MSKLKNWLPAIIMCLIIFAASSVPGAVIQSTGYGEGKYNIRAHLFLYFLLCISLYKATKSIPKSIVLAFLYGITDEFHQTFVPGRAWEYMDLGVNSIGIILAGTILWKLQFIIPNKLKTWLQN